jgi:hypothetical protein
VDTLDDVAYRTRAAVTLRGILNDLKRNEAVAARELGVDPDVLERVLAGQAPVSAELIGKAVRTWPVNERDFFPLHDDAPAGVIVMRAAESASSARVLRRGGTDYYEYRDTAMSRVSSIRPEWIAMLQVVADADPGNPLVQWNNGHFLYQFTYFVGEVNYYYAWGGKRFCVPMSTGDSVFGLPFARHSFAARRKDAPALILALTYGGKLSGDAQHELSALGRDAVEGTLLPVGDARRTQAAKLRELMANGSISAERLAQDCAIAPERLTALLRAAADATGAEAEALARALRVPLRELESRLLEPDVHDGVRIVRAAEAPVWPYPGSEAPSYEIRELAGSRVTPYARSIELRALPGAARDAHELEVGLHQYGYVVGTSPVVLRWRRPDGKTSQRTLAPDDSFFVKPFVPCAFAPADQGDGADARVVLLRAGGKLVGDAALEASQIGATSLNRLVAETGMWYDAEGSR